MTTALNIRHTLFRAPASIADPGSGGSITIDRYGGVCHVVTATAESRTLIAPTKAGIVGVVVLKTDGGNLTLTVAGGWNQAGDTTLTLPDAGSRVMLHSIQVGTGYYWRVVAAEAVTEAVAEDIDIHALTALSAVPAADDLVAVSDESTASDPTRAVTVTELLSAAGDLTDLGAVPAIDDRILLTDESAAGDPAKSTTVENLFSALGDVTALSGAPAIDDLLVVTDESTAGDPVRAITVTELFTAAGDLTDLAAAPATDDRLLVTDESVANDPAKSMSVANLFGAYTDDITPGTGISGGTGTYCKASVTRFGSLYKTEILIDLTGLSSKNTVDDIIGTGVNPAHLGQITAAKNGTIFAGCIRCLETPATGDDDIDLYAATENTGVYDGLVTDLTETALLTAGGALAAGTTYPLTAFPAADKYLYLASGNGDTAGAYSAGILLIELWGR